ncbi:MAG TPA: transposase [Nocardioides sp.]|uniref:transposase n=1 Tax=Nocardioides sp. TaxID=35761 RepID=UPI002E30EC1D|nr:transposase [Nocardioides sp.]HEX3929629.1 transposase [Nocardioides sp.]
MRSLLQSIINTLLSADADAVGGCRVWLPVAGPYESAHWVRHRDLDTRVGTIDVAVPKQRKGSYFPEWLLKRRSRWLRAAGYGAPGRPVWPGGRRRTRPG